MEENALNMLTKGLEKPKEVPEVEELEMPKHSIDELLYYAIEERSKCKWYHFFTKSVWDKIIKSTQSDLKPEGLNIGLSNLKEDVVEITQSITQFYYPHTEIGLIKIDVKDELAVNLINKGIIKFTESKGEEFGKETITIKASINIKK
ncbi:MAG: hypothetical protein ACTSSP_08465 [Candidatus Asgardarchaeia archaeon]